MKFRPVFTVTTLVLLVALAGGSQAVRQKPAPASCWMTPTPMTAGQDAYVWATGLPTRTALNVFVVNGGETYGFPVGAHADGLLEWVRYTPEHAGSIQVTVTGPETGHTKVYATCGGEVQAG